MKVDSLEPIAKAIQDAKTIAICGHVKPDGDCLGSVCGLGSMLVGLGKYVVLLLADGVLPGTFEFLPGADILVDAEGYEGSPDLFIALDTPSQERLGRGAAVLARSGSSVSIDHHPGSQDFAGLCYLDDKAAAVGMLVWDLGIVLGVKPTPEIAASCYAAIMTDTGRFQFQNTDARALAHAASCCEAGASPSDIAIAIYQSRSLASIQLESRVMERISFSPKHRVAYSWIRRSDIEELDARPEDSDELIDTVRSLAGISVAMLLHEGTDGIRGSIRAKGPFDVSAVARQLGGGGHVAAAGFTFKGTLEDCIATVMPLLAGADEA